MSYKGIFRRSIISSVTLAAGGVLLLLVLVGVDRPAIGASETVTAPCESEPCIVEPHFNADNLDYGIAIDRKKSPFFHSRATSSAGQGYLDIDQFESPETCAGCHEEIYEQWKGSMHSNAWNDPIYLALMRLAGKATKGATDNLCIGCHTPIGLTTGEATPDGERLSELAKDGVQCEFCHNISAVSGIGNAAFVLTPNKYGRPLKFGPFEDANSPYHDTTYSELHTKSEICGACHNVTHPLNRVPMERTYDEWRDSPYPAEGIGCQECHMTPGPGFNKNPGMAAIDGKEREHIYTHYFVGGNTMVTALLGAENHARLSREMLRGAATLELVSVRNARPGATAAVVLRVHNSGAGHKLPTGFPEGREMWVDFRVTDDKGEPIYRLGRLDEAGRPEDGTHSFKVILGDDAGNIIDVEVWKATRILSDNRILPRGYADVRFEVPLPAGVGEKVTITADLNYHSFSQHFVDRLLGENAPKVPTELMTSLTRQTSLANSNDAGGK
jgi:hypothetical protein